MTNNSNFSPARPHGELNNIFEDIYMVTGSMNIQGRLPLSFSRNMTVIRENSQLTLINSVRLNDSGLAHLENLGTVKNIIRLAGFHGIDDAFYKDRYKAKVWSVTAPYFEGVNFDIEIHDGYFQPDVLINNSTSLPIQDSRPVCIDSSSPKELLIYMERDEGILITGDSLQNWAKPDKYFNLPAKIMMRLMGFIKPCNIGPGWRKYARPDTAELKSIMDLNFEHLLPAHGSPVIGNARGKYLHVFKTLES